MTRHVFDDTSLECSDELLITTVIATRTEKGEFAPNLVLTRDRLRQDESEATYVSRQLVDLARGLKKFRLHGRTEVSVGGRVGHCISCAWQGGQGPLEQRITIVVKDHRALTFTVTVPKSKAEQLFPTFDAIVASLAIAD